MTKPVPFTYIGFPRSDRYRIHTRLDQAVQDAIERRRANAAFTLRLRPEPLSMTYLACDNCHATFGTTWLDHCPCCGSHDVTETPDLALAHTEAN